MVTMSRMLSTALLLALVAGPVSSQEKTPPKAKLAAKTDVIDLIGKRITVEQFEGRFGEVIEYLREKHGLPVVIDRSLITEDDTPVENLMVRWPALKSVRLETMLRLVGDQVKGMHLVRPDGVVFVGYYSGLTESGVLKSDDDNPLPLDEVQKSRPLTQRALVNASFKDRTLEEIIEFIADATGANLILAPQARDVANQQLTVRFANTPVDAAVRTLCEMTDLGVIEDANVLIVTTRERAEARAKEAEKKRKARMAEQNAIFGGGIGIAAPVDVSAEIAQLKEQNAELKKQLDEIRERLKK